MEYENVPDIFKELSLYLKENYNGKIAAGGSEVVIRCPFCGDSRNLSDAHLYIGVNKKSNKLICYNCFRCGQSGIVSGALFRELRCTELQLINDVLEYNKSRTNKNIGNIRTQRNYKPIIRYANENGLINVEQKLLYISNRLGIQFSLDDLSRLKIIVSLKKYLYDNHISTITRQKDVVNDIDKYCIGFLSVDSSYIVNRAIIDLKNVNSLIKQRYINYRLYNQSPSTTLYYVIPNTINIMKEITLHMAEGIFDILGIYYHVSKDHTNSIYMTTANKMAFLQAFQYIVSFLKLVPSMITIHAYFDKEDDGSFSLRPYYQFINSVKPWVNGLIFHINDYPGEKDFGVPANHIIDKIL